MLETNAIFRKIAIGNHKLYRLTDEDTAAVQAVLREMLVDFDTVCRKHGLTYFLCGGTALGAAREKGFIEWDEDADVGLPRADYDKFRELFVAEFGDKYHVQCIEKSERYDLTFMKIRKKGTKYIEIFETEPEIAGIFIDVYALENTPDNALLRFFHGCISDFLYLCCSCVRIKTKKQRFLEYITDSKTVRLIRFKAFLGSCLSFFSLQKWCRIALKWSALCKNDKSKFVSYPNGRNHYFGELCSRSSFFPPKDADFDGLRLSNMADSHEYLTRLYGDYMTVPAEDKRERHSILELNIGEINE